MRRSPSREREEVSETIDWYRERSALKKRSAEDGA